MAVAAFIVVGEQVKFTTSVMRGGISGKNPLHGWYQSAIRVIANNMAVDLSVGRVCADIYEY
jgi:hypothetical protein